MRRTKQWWAQLTKDERHALMYIEHRAKLPTLLNRIPDRVHNCKVCSDPYLSHGLCVKCSNRLSGLIAKAEKGAST